MARHAERNKEKNSRGILRLALRLRDLAPRRDSVPLRHVGDGGRHSDAPPIIVFAGVRDVGVEGRAFVARLAAPGDRAGLVNGGGLEAEDSAVCALESIIAPLTERARRRRMPEVPAPRVRGEEDHVSVHAEPPMLSERGVHGDVERVPVHEQLHREVVHERAGVGREKIRSRERHDGLEDAVAGRNTHLASFNAEYKMDVRLDELEEVLARSMLVDDRAAREHNRVPVHIMLRQVLVELVPQHGRDEL